MEPSETGRAAGASSPRAARRWAARAPSTATSTIAASRIDFDTWAQLGNRGWGYADVLPYFRRMERRIGDGDAGRHFRGRDGNLTDHRHSTGAIRSATPSSKARSKPASRATPTTTARSQEGVAYAQRTIQNGRRVSAARGFLHPAMKRAEPRRAHARARDHRRAGGQARRRHALSDRAAGAAMPREVRARRKSSCAAGAYNSPAAAAALRHRPGRAAGLARHPGAACAGRRRREPARPLRAALRRAREEHRDHQRAGRAASSSSARSLKYALTRQGILSLSPTLRLLLLALRADGRRTTIFSSPSRRRATRKACRASSTTSRA